MATQQTVLVTAFEPFGGRSTNRSQLVLEHINRAAASPKGIREGVKIVTKTLPVSFQRVGKAMERALSCKPDVVILLGESGPAEQLRLERVAVNRIDAKIPDNDGKQPSGTPVIADGPAAYFSTTRPKLALASVRKAGASAAISNDAGLYACNAAYYLTLHRLHRHHRQGTPLPQVVFVHIPVRGRALPLRDATKGVLALLRHLLDENSPKPQRSGKKVAADEAQVNRKA